MPARRVGAYYNWVVQDGYPEFTDTGEKSKCLFVCQDITTNPPQIGDVCPYDVNLRVFNIDDKVYKADLYEVMITYAKPDVVAEKWKTNGQTIGTLSDAGIQKAIELHPNYKTCWKYNLAKIKTETSNTFTNWDTQTTLVIPSAFQESFAWVEYSGEVPDGWVICQGAKKPGISTYELPSPVIQEKTYFFAKSSADSLASTVGKRKIPVNNFGKLPNTITNWLVTGCSVTWEYPKWVAELTYTWADNVDVDIYPATA